MGIGSVVGAISGVSSIIGSRKQAKAASKAMGMASDAYAKGESYLQGGLDFALSGGGIGSGGAGGVPTAREGLSHAKQVEQMLNQLGKEYGEFAQGLWTSWEDTWGDMRSNLVDYYDNLDPNKYAVGMKAEIRQNLDKQFEQFDQTAAQSGIYTSGMKLQAQKEKDFAMAQEFAGADIQAPEMVRDMQTQFYGAFGAPERSEALNAQQNAYNFRGQMGQAGGALTQGAYGTLASMEESAAQRAAAASAARANMIMGAYNQGANYYGNMGDKYAGSAAGYGKSAGTLFGSGVKSLTSAAETAFPDFKLF